MHSVTLMHSIPSKKKRNPHSLISAIYKAKFLTQLTLGCIIISAYLQYLNGERMIPPKKKKFHPLCVKPSFPDSSFSHILLKPMDLPSYQLFTIPRLRKDDKSKKKL